MKTTDLGIAAWNWGAKTGLFYAGTNLLCNIWCWFRLPETKDRTFGEIDLLFHHRVPARKFKYTKVDRTLLLSLLRVSYSNIVGRVCQSAGIHIKGGGG
jgi:hypothetical protein